MSSLTQILLALALCAGITFASPIAGPVADPQYMYGNPVPYCSDDDGILYTIYSQNIKSADPKTGDYTVAGNIEGSLSASSTFSIGVTTTIGIDVGIAKIASLGLSASVATSKTDSKTQGTSLNCPKGDWYCAIQIYPEILEVTGHMEQKKNAPNACSKVPQDFTVQYPRKGASGDVRSRVEVCSCSNFPHWADNGAPSLHCGDCASPLDAQPE